MRPTIGIAASYDEDKGVLGCPKTYVDAVLEAGGKPVLIPIMPQDLAGEMLSQIDGLLFPGGADVDPALYGEHPNQHLGRVSPLLDAMEIGLAKKALATDIPILGICRGCQVVTVASGGTLYQDIPSQVPGAMKHNQLAPRWHGSHEVSLDQDSLAARAFGRTKLMANSFHHQSVKKPGDGFIISGRAPDGIVEALESAKGFRLLLQWHPEGMWTADRAFLGPFQALCRAALGQEPV